TIWDTFEANHQTRLSEIMGGPGGGSTAVGNALNGAANLGLTQQQGAGILVRQVVGQAYLGAALDFFRISAIIVLLLIPLIWLCKETRAQGPVHAAAD
ncbi:MAG: MFS transporter, partial [Asticcacaulis sp.]|nr:MFS transporter [Asticcacaulis sp.]